MLSSGGLSQISHHHQTDIQPGCDIQAGCLSDDGLFVISDGQAKVIGILAMRVDDVMGGGTDVLRMTMEKVSDTM